MEQTAERNIESVLLGTSKLRMNDGSNDTFILKFLYFKRQD